MLYSGITHVEKVPVEEDIQREKAFAEATLRYANALTQLKTAHIPLIIHPGKRVKSKKEMREIEENLVESRKPQKVTPFKRPSKKERRKKSQVEEKVKNALASTPETDEPNGRGSKPGNLRKLGKKTKKPRLGKSKRQKVSHRK
ncbi:uncharacterized protein NEMAJ01_1444 [Nematocida major]|uniref:uncharacterized protein n=1 Tax=Nematocida major TaxID=1912982 RepID=UPI002007269D|nr:uncharacterized protein NEMAJ01_1444 [Nematocida major]KAH9386548.1 hypothetical protein NEMAJ01_1444 [Nematocida major]